MAPQEPATEADLPWAESSLVTVEPTEISLTRERRQTQATVRVEIAHTPLKSEQAVKLAVGTFRTEPPTGVSASYDPPSQTVRLPAGPQGKVNAMAKMFKLPIGSNGQATVVVVASIKPASSAIRIEHDDPGQPNHQATLTIRNK